VAYFDAEIVNQGQTKLTETMAKDVLNWLKIW